MILFSIIPAKNKAKNNPIPKTIHSTTSLVIKTDPTIKGEEIKIVKPK